MYCVTDSKQLDRCGRTKKKEEGKHRKVREQITSRQVHRVAIGREREGGEREKERGGEREGEREREREEERKGRERRKEGGKERETLILYCFRQSP